MNKWMMRVWSLPLRERGVRYRLYMAMASYEYSHTHGLTRREALAGALELFWELEK